MSERHQARSDSLKVRVGPRRAVFTVVVSALVVVSLGLLSACSSNTSQAPSEKVQTMLQERWVAMNTGDTKTVAKAFATNSVCDNYADGGANTQGSEAIAAYFEDARTGFGMQWGADGDPIQYDKYVVQPVEIYGLEEPSGTGRCVHVMEIDANDQIVHEWIVGWVAPPEE
jgi:hypothetical protein